MANKNKNEPTKPENAPHFESSSPNPLESSLPGEELSPGALPVAKEGEEGLLRDHSGTGLPPEKVDEFKLGETVDLRSNESKSDQVVKPVDIRTLPEAERPPEPESGEPVYRIAAGHGITTLRGILGDGEVVSARDFSGGQKNLDELVASGAVVKS